MESLRLKTNYRCVPALQQFYTGGPFVVSSDNSFIACACGESIKIVDSVTAALRSTLDADSESVTALALSPDNRLLFSSSHSRQIRVWDLSTFKCVRSWKGHDGPVMCMTCHPSGGLLATGGADRKVLVWDVDGGYCTHYFKGHGGVVSCVMFHPDPEKQLLFSGSDDGGDNATVRVWDVSKTKKKNCIATLDNHRSAVTSLAISEDGWTLLSSGRDKVVTLWDLHDYSNKKTVITNEAVEAVCVIGSSSPFASSLHSYKQDAKKRSGSKAFYFITVGERGIVRIWNSKGAGSIFEQKTSDVTASIDDDDGSRRGFTSAVMLPSDQGLLCVTADQQFLVYSLECTDELLQLNLTKRLVGYNEEIVDMKFLGDDEKFLALATNLEQVRIYDTASMSCSYVLSGHTEIVLCLDTCVSTSGKTLIVTGSKDNSVRLWDSESANCIGVGIGHMGAVGAIAFSKRKRDFFVSGSSDHTLKVWSMDGLSDNMTVPFNLKAKAVVAAHDKDINSVAVAPNDSLVCSGSQDRTACVWRLPDLVSVVVFKGHKRGIWSVEFSPVDQCVVTASGDKTVRIWAISDGSCLKTFEGHTSSVLRALFVSRGTQIVSCGADGLVKLWTVKTNECVATYDHHEDKVWALAVGKKTEMLATGGGDAVVNLWFDSTASDKEEAFRKEEEGVLKGQELENAVSDADYSKAIQIAFELRRPHRLFELFSELCRKREAEEHLDRALKGLGDEELRILFNYVREWNTKPKLCYVSQFVLFRVFSVFPPTHIVEIKGIGEVLEGLIPYSQRHFGRIDRLVRSTFLLDFILSGMSVIEPEAQPTESKTKLLLQSDIHIPDTENDIEERDDSPEITASKKRKSKRSRHGSHKKVKNVAFNRVESIPLQA
ncbi:transducin beta-like protein 3 isoform X2 [Vigna unguiculata]|uniref:U3 small nucleolar RNA-associated protein 13 n=1 Tax=Vigna unguiculata TaxID=3917 RepID=A0A4D6KTM6_VIGUN|nr:transducin beta-like protein 3 isoform X2 [Vigna unguiculata]QCD81068.1 U3 small nucleolar RNA-associated protein 13 [Vigna unguiculata]